MIAKEVKLVVLSRVHQYLDHWFIRAQSRTEILLKIKTIVSEVDNQPGKVDTEPGVLFCGLWIPPELSPCKSNSRQIFIPKVKLNYAFTARCFTFLIVLLVSTEEMVTEGCLHLRMV